MFVAGLLEVLSMMFLGLRYPRFGPTVIMALGVDLDLD